MFSSPLSFAREELCRYAGLMDPAFCPDGILFAPFTSDQMCAHHIRDPYWDDAYEVHVQNGTGRILYANERSALLAVYHLLREAGCAFLRPGQLGEIIPRRELSCLCANISMTAAYRHRCICIEGSNALENIVDIIDYAPKAGYNAYFTQFMEAYTFFERWYTHMDNPLRPGGVFTEEMAHAYLDTCIRELKRRGLIYHAVGHGWTCEPFGIPGKSWESVTEEPTPEQEKHLALLGGRRHIRGGIGLNTNLCYSQSETRKVMVDAIADYALKHPEIDIIHVWLGDENNNHCECENCQKMIPADFYVMLLNEIDEALTRIGSPVRIAFLLYYELLLPPEHNRILNENRFILMYAPITRQFSKSYKGVVPRYNGQKYVRNQMYFATDVAENLGFLSEWRKQFSGDGFDFDYHLCGAYQFEPGSMLISKVLHDDITALSGLGFGGMINCQLQRVSMPSGFPLFIGGQTLMDPALDFEQVKENYFSLSYGREYKSAVAFLETMSELFPLDNMRNFNPTQEAADRCEKLRDYCKTHVLPDYHGENPCQARAWDMLRFWQKFWVLASEYVRCMMNGDDAGRKRAFKPLEAFTWETEPLFQSEFDSYFFLHMYRRRFGD